MTSLTEVRQAALDCLVKPFEERERSLSVTWDHEARRPAQDECARTILVEAMQKPRSAAELSDCAGVSEPTVYRDSNGSESTILSPKLSASHRWEELRLYRSELDGIELDLSEDGSTSRSRVGTGWSTASHSS